MVTSPTSGSRGAGTAPGDRDALLALASAHERAGRLADAVSALAEAHRAHADAAVARDLVRLRRAAAAAAAPTESPPGPWPPDLPDPFPGHDGVPDVASRDLTAATLGGALLHHGCLLVREAVPAPLADALREKVIRSIAARDRALAEAPEPTDEDWYTISTPRSVEIAVVRRSLIECGMLAVDAPLVLCEVLDAYRISGVISAIQGYLGEPPMLAVDKTVLRKVLSSQAVWHQDGKFMEGGARAVNVWLSLSDCGPGAKTPSIDIVPARIDEILETRQHGTRYSHIDIGQDLLEEVAPDRPWMTPRFSPGDALMFDERFVHRSGSGEGYDQHRYSVESWFFGASRIPTGYSPLAL